MDLVLVRLTRMVFLFALLWISSTAVKETYDLRNFTIAVISAQHSIELERASSLAELHIKRQSILPNNTELNVRAFVLENYTMNLQSSLHDFCDNLVVTENIVGVVVTEKLYRGPRYSFTPWLASYLGIPVFLTQNSRFNHQQKEELDTVISLKPAISELDKAITALLHHLGLRTFALVTTTDDENPQEITELVEKFPFQEGLHRVPRITHVQLNTHDSRDVTQKLTSINASGVMAIVLHCSSSAVKIIFDSARLVGLVTRTHAWIVTENVIDSCRDLGAPECPAGLIGVRLKKSRDPTLTNHGLVYDGIIVYAHALARLLHEGNSLSTPPRSCNETSRWRAGTEIYRQVITGSANGSTGLINFDKEGNRIDPEYEMVSLQDSGNGTSQWTAVALWHHGLRWPTGYNFPPDYFPRPSVWRVVTAHTEPFVFYSDDSHRDATLLCGIGYACAVHNNADNSTAYHCCKGLVIDLLKMLQTDVGFTAELHLVKDGKYGARDKLSGEWNGMIGEILRGEADMAISDLTITDTRSHAVDFTHPFLHSGLNVLVSADKLWSTKDYLVRFLAPFSTELWLLTIGAINGVFLLNWLLDRLSPFGCFRKGATYQERKRFDLVASLWFTWGTIFHIDEGDARPKSPSARTMTVMFGFGMIIITTTYTANLAAVLVTEQETKPISSAGIKDPKLQDPPEGFKVAVVSDTSPENLFRESTDPAFSRIWRHMKHNNVATFSEGVDKVASGEIDVFIGDEPGLYYATSHQNTCQLRVVGRPFFQSGFGLAFPKNSSWTAVFSKVLIYYEKIDVAEKLSQRWLRGSCANDDRAGKYDHMTVKDVSGAFIIVTIAIGLTFLLLLAEFKVAQYGFPFSDIWTNDPGWMPRPGFSVSNADTPPSQNEILEFWRRRDTSVRDLQLHVGLSPGRDNGADLFRHRLSALAFPTVRVNEAFDEDATLGEENDSGVGSLSPGLFGTNATNKNMNW